MSLTAAFDVRCEQLSASVQRSCDNLTAIHANRMSRDVDNVRSLHSEVTRVRAAVEGLANDLQPRLDRLASSEPQHALPPRHLAWDFTAAPSKQQELAASRLQAAWRRSHPHGAAIAGGSQHARFCPEILRRNFVLGIRTLPAGADAGKASAQASALPPLALVQAPSVAAARAAPPPKGGNSGCASHFMSIL